MLVRPEKGWECGLEKKSFAEPLHGHARNAGNIFRVQEEKEVEQA